MLISLACLEKWQLVFYQFCVFQLVSAENNRYSLDHISSLFTSQVG